MEKEPEREFYFDSLRLKMGGGGRFLVRLISYIFYGSATAAAVVLVFAELKWMQSLGVFLFLFLIDRLIHLHHAEERLSHMSARGRINLAYYLVPEGYAVVERAAEKAVFVGGDFHLWAAGECLADMEVKKIIVRQGTEKKELERRIKKMLKERPRSRISRMEALAAVDGLIKVAGKKAIERQGKFIEVRDLFSASFVFEE